MFKSICNAVVSLPAEDQVGCLLSPVPPVKAALTRRVWSLAEKRAIVVEASAPGVNASAKGYSAPVRDGCTLDDPASTSARVNMPRSRTDGLVGMPARLRARRVRPS